MKRKKFAQILFIVLLLLLFSLTASSALAQLSISPGCYDIDKNAKCIPINVTKEDKPIDLTFRVYNKASSNSSFRVFVEPKNYSDYVLIDKRSFTLPVYDNKNCGSGQGCEIVTAVINVSALEYGLHSFYIVAQTTEGGGSLPINLQVKSRISINMKKPVPYVLYIALALITILVIIFLIFFMKSRKDNNPDNKMSKKQIEEEKAEQERLNNMVEKHERLYKKYKDMTKK